MKFDIFVKPTDTVSDSFLLAKYETDFYCGDDYDALIQKIYDKVNDGNAKDLITTIKNNLPESDIEKIEVVFQVPDFNLNTFIWQKSLKPKDKENGEQSVGDYYFDVVEYTRCRLVLLLKDWNITDKNNKKIEVTPENINSLHPTIVQAIIEKLNKNIQTYQMI
jgi:hypothetical protein